MESAAISNVLRALRDQTACCALWTATQGNALKTAKSAAAAGMAGAVDGQARASALMAGQVHSVQTRASRL